MRSHARRHSSRNRAHAGDGLPAFAWGRKITDKQKDSCRAEGLTPVRMLDIPGRQTFATRQRLGRRNPGFLVSLQTFCGIKRRRLAVVQRLCEKKRRPFAGLQNLCGIFRTLIDVVQCKNEFFRKGLVRFQMALWSLFCRLTVNKCKKAL